MNDNDRKELFNNLYCYSSEYLHMVGYKDKESKQLGLEDIPINLSQVHGLTKIEKENILNQLYRRSIFHLQKYLAVTPPRDDDKRMEAATEPRQQTATSFQENPRTPLKGTSSLRKTKKKLFHPDVEPDGDDDDAGGVDIDASGEGCCCVKQIKSSKTTNQRTSDALKLISKSSDQNTKQPLKRKRIDDSPERNAKVIKLGGFQPKACSTPIPENEKLMLRSRALVRRVQPVRVIRTEVKENEARFLPIQELPHTEDIITSSPQLNIKLTANNNNIKQTRDNNKQTANNNNKQAANNNIKQISNNNNNIKQTSDNNNNIKQTSNNNKPNVPNKNPNKNGNTKKLNDTDLNKTFEMPAENESLAEATSDPTQPEIVTFKIPAPPPAPASSPVSPPPKPPQQTKPSKPPIDDTSATKPPKRMMTRSISKSGNLVAWPSQTEAAPTTVEVFKVPEAVSRSSEEDVVSPGGDDDDEKQSVEMLDWCVIKDGTSFLLSGYVRSPDKKFDKINSAIASRRKSKLIETSDGKLYKLMKSFVKSRSNLPDVSQHFKNGFPENWKEILDKAAQEIKLVTTSEKKPKAQRKQKSSLNSSFFDLPEGKGTAETPLSTEDLKQTRKSGRHVVPPLAYWKGQRVFVDPKTNETQVIEGSKNCLDSSDIHFKQKTCG